MKTPTLPDRYNLTDPPSALTQDWWLYFDQFRRSGSDRISIDNAARQSTADFKSDHLSVAMQGGVPDNSTDTATAIENALADLPSTGGSIFFPAGDPAGPSQYKISRTIVINKVGVSLRGAGAGKIFSGPSLLWNGRAHTSWTCTADAGSDTITATAHTLQTGDLIRFDTSGTLPGGLRNTRSYWVINALTNTLQVAATRGGSAIDITSAGTGTHTLYYDAVMIYVANGKHGFSIEDLRLDGNNEAGICLQVDANAGSSTHQPQLRDITFQGYRRRGLVLGPDDWGVLSNGQMQNVAIENCSWTGGLQGAWGALQNAQNIEFSTWLRPYFDPAVGQEHEHHIRSIAGGIQILSLLSTRASDYALSTNEQCVVNGWRAEDPKLIRFEATFPDAPLALHNVRQRFYPTTGPVTQPAATDAVISVAATTSPVTLTGLQIQGSINFSATDTRNLWASNVTFDLPGADFVFAGPQAQSGFIHRTDTGVAYLRGRQPWLNAKTPQGTDRWYFKAGLDVADSITFTADASTDTLTLAGHHFINGDSVSVSSSGTLPAPLAAATQYYVVGSLAGSLQLAATLGGAAIDLTTAGTGTHSITPYDAIAQAGLLRGVMAFRQKGRSLSANTDVVIISNEPLSSPSSGFGSSICFEGNAGNEAYITGRVKSYSLGTNNAFGVKLQARENAVKTDAETGLTLHPYGVVQIGRGDWAPDTTATLHVWNDGGSYSIPTRVFIQAADSVTQGTTPLLDLQDISGAPILSAYFDGTVLLKNGTKIFNVTATPQGSVTANPGSLAVSTGGVLYVKTTGTGNTGWSALTTGGAGGALLAANNLSDLANTATSRTNLGVDAGLSVAGWTVTLAKITAGGANGSLSVDTHGRITGYTAPT